MVKIPGILTIEIGIILTKLERVTIVNTQKA